MPVMASTDGGLEGLPLKPVTSRSTPLMPNTNPPIPYLITILSQYGQRLINEQRSYLDRRA